MKISLLALASLSFAAAQVGAQSSTTVPRPFNDPADLPETRAGKQV